MKALILAGGLGSRLKPFTEAIPKPLLPIGESSILELQISRLKRYAFNEIFIATFYKANYISSFLGDGSRLGVSLTISKETKPLGTCGPVSLLKDRLDEPFVMMNGDILTTLDFGRLYRYAMDNSALLTVVTKRILTPFNFGNVQSVEDRIVRVEEKPNFHFEILAGIYVLKPELFPHIPDGEYFGIDTLITRMLGAGLKVARYLMTEYWIDIGRLDDFSEAQLAYEKHFRVDD
ncbi:MAG TPA: sugar phosphate nucleotidyltransferase [bacterium]|jgi:NDP-sugar pyrophosphorylase family protein|nr:sugar phosphate nucleotidyltransferase [bacterium]HQM52901.1 sugar phosphate nucleotidyltransferase [bacterium]